MGFFYIFLAIHDTYGKRVLSSYYVEDFAYKLRLSTRTTIYSSPYFVSAFFCMDHSFILSEKDIEKKE